MEIGLVLLVGTVLFGNKLPGIARSVGSSFVQFKKGLSGVEDEVKTTVSEVNKAIKS
jgi:sec-independent protein translocase protein TatA